MNTMSRCQYLIAGYLLDEETCEMMMVNDLSKKLTAMIVLESKVLNEREVEAWT
jgi:hypothetical protein